MTEASNYFPLSLESLRMIGGWAADCAARALAIYAMQPGADDRPQAALAGIREFAGGGKRAARLRALAMAAHAAAREIDNPAAAAARAAGHAAASAYTHPLRDVQQTKHIVGAAAYAALALELHHPDDPTIADREVAWAIAQAPPAVGEVLQEMHARTAGKSRIDALLYALDAGLRGQLIAHEQ